jgi:hypothetical protein
MVYVTRRNQRRYKRTRRTLTCVAALLLCAGAAWVATAARSSLVAPEKTLSCNEINGFDAKPPIHWHVVLGGVALPPQRWFRSGPPYANAYRPLPYYAKAGLEVHAQRPAFDVLVPAAWRDRLGLGWGENHQPTFASVIHVPRCAAVLGNGWVWWAGGYFLRKPACVPVIVRSHTQSIKIWLAIGRSCP